MPPLKEPVLDRQPPNFIRNMHGNAIVSPGLYEDLEDAVFSISENNMNSSRKIGDASALQRGPLVDTLFNPLFWEYRIS